ncbi:MAG: glycosyltransferase family 4 protein [Planctomycetota bacterium]
MTGPMHVAVSGWLLGGASGANRRLLALLHELPHLLADDERITLLHRPGAKPDLPARIEPQAIDVPTGPTLRRAFREQSLVPRALRDLGANVYDHGFLPPPRTHGVPTCLLVHDLRAADGESPWPPFLFRSVLRKATRRCQAIVVPSAWTAQRLAEVVPEAPPAHVVPNAVHRVPPAAAPPPPAARAIPDNGYVLHVGHLEKRKNLEVLIAALAKLEPSVRPELWLVGRDAGSLAGLYRQADQSNVAESLHHFATVTDDELPSYYAHARQIVVPSRHEGFGLCALEGLAHGRPVLAANATALPEVVGAAGTLLPASDPAAWAHAISAPLLDDDAVHAATRRAQASLFSWRKSAAALLAVWRSL